MAVINKYESHTIDPNILSIHNVDQAGDVVSAETWVALWDLVWNLLAKYNEHFIDIYHTLEEINAELSDCIKRVEFLEGQYQGLVDRMGNLETSWSALQEAYNKVAGCYDEIKQIQNTLESGFVHYGEEPPTTDFIKLWVMPTQGVPSLITSWGTNDILATNYNYASAKLIKDTLNTKVNKAGDTITGPLVFNQGLATPLKDAGDKWWIGYDGGAKFKGVAGDFIRIYTDDDKDHDIVFGKSHGAHVVGASLGGHRVRNVGAPTEDTDAATKEYVDKHDGIFKYEPFEKEYTVLDLNYTLTDSGVQQTDVPLPLEQDFDYTKYFFELLYVNHCPDNVITVEYTTASDPTPKRMVLDVVNPWEHDYGIGYGEYDAYQYPDAQTVETGLAFGFRTHTEEPLTLYLTSVYLPDDHEYTSLKIINAYTRVRYQNKINTDRIQFMQKSIPRTALPDDIPISKLQPLKGNATVLQKVSLPASTEEPVRLVSLSLPKRTYPVYTCLGSFKLTDTTAVPDFFEFTIHLSNPANGIYFPQRIKTIKIQPGVQSLCRFRFVWRMECICKDVYRCSLSLSDQSYHNYAYDSVEQFIDLTDAFEHDDWSISFKICDETSSTMDISAVTDDRTVKDTTKGAVLYGSKC